VLAGGIVRCAGAMSATAVRTDEEIGGILDQGKPVLPQNRFAMNHANASSQRNWTRYCLKSRGSLNLSVWFYQTCRMVADH